MAPTMAERSPRAKGVQAMPPGDEPNDGRAHAPRHAWAGRRRSSALAKTPIEALVQRCRDGSPDRWVHVALSFPLSRRASSSESTTLHRESQWLSVTSECSCPTAAEPGRQVSGNPSGSADMQQAQTAEQRVRVLVSVRFGAGAAHHLDVRYRTSRWIDQRDTGALSSWAARNKSPHPGRFGTHQRHANAQFPVKQPRRADSQVPGEGGPTPSAGRDTATARSRNSDVPGATDKNAPGRGEGQQGGGRANFWAGRG